MSLLRGTTPEYVVLVGFRIVGFSLIIGGIFVYRGATSHGHCVALVVLGASTVSELQEGDSIRMVREGYWLQSPIASMLVERIDHGRTLVLRGHDGGTWTFHLDPIDAKTTRFVVRGRRPETRTALGYAVRYLTYELPHFVMERGMMPGIEARTERHGRDGDRHPS